MPHFHKVSPMSRPTGILVTCLPAFQKVRFLIQVCHLIPFLKAVLALRYLRKFGFIVPPESASQRKQK